MMWEPTDVADDAANRGNLWCNTVVSLRHKVLYVSVPKAACTKMRMFMHLAEGLRLPSADQLHYKMDRAFGYNHRLTDFTSDVAAKILTSPKWWRFAFVRNPYTRLISAYQSKIHSGDPQFRGQRDAIRAWHGFDQYRGPAPDPGAAESGGESELHGEHEEQPEAERDPIPFRAFIEFCCAMPDAKRDWHWKLQCRIVEPMMINYDFIGRFENFYLDSLHVLRRLGIPADASLIHGLMNPSDRAEDAVFDQRLARMVLDAYRLDFLHFHYDAESWRSI